MIMRKSVPVLHDIPAEMYNMDLAEVLFSYVNAPLC